MRLCPTPKLCLLQCCHLGLIGRRLNDFSKKWTHLYSLLRIDFFSDGEIFFRHRIFWFFVSFNLDFWRDFGLEEIEQTRLLRSSFWFFGGDRILCRKSYKDSNFVTRNQIQICISVFASCSSSDNFIVGNASFLSGFITVNVLLLKTGGPNSTMKRLIVVLSQKIQPRKVAGYLMINIDGIID